MSDHHKHESVIEDHLEPLTVFVSIGNSDDRLPQSAWAEYFALVDARVGAAAAMIHGRWVSVATDPYQNACWAFQPSNLDGWWGAPEGGRETLREALADLARQFGQDSIAWAETEVGFIEPEQGA